MSAHKLGPSSLFNLTVDHICDGAQELPDFAGFPECMIQQIMSRIICRQRQTAALQLLRQRGVLSLLEIPVDTAINDEWLVAIGAQACSMEDLSIANCSDATSEGVLQLQKLTRLSRLHMYQLPVLGGVAAHFIGSMPYLKDLHLEGPQGGIELNEALCTSLGFTTTCPQKSQRQCLAGHSVD